MVVKFDNTAHQQRVGALQITFGHEYDLGFVVDAFPIQRGKPAQGAEDLFVVLGRIVSQCDRFLDRELRFRKSGLILAHPLHRVDHRPVDPFMPCNELFQRRGLERLKQIAQLDGTSGRCGFCFRRRVVPGRRRRGRFTR